MPKNVFKRPPDLITPDGHVVEIKQLNDHSSEVSLEIDNISSTFKGFEIDRSLIQFNLKSTINQLGVDARTTEVHLEPKFGKAQVKIVLKAYSSLGKDFIPNITKGLYIGKLFAADDRRRVRKEEYLQRLIGKTDEDGDSLLLLGEEYQSEKIVEQDDKNRTIVYVPIYKETFMNDQSIRELYKTITRGLMVPETSFRQFLQFHQEALPPSSPQIEEPFFLVRSKPMSLRTLFARIALDELPEGITQDSPSIIEPRGLKEDSFAFHGAPRGDLEHIPLEFYTRESFREHFFFSDRSNLQQLYQQPETLFKAFETAPEGNASTFIVKGEQFRTLTEDDWIESDLASYDKCPTPPANRKERAELKKFVTAQSAYTILKGMQEGDITSQGIMLTNYFPSPPLKNFLLNERVTRCLQAIYFRTPSKTFGDYFSHADRSMLHDLAKASVEIYWVDFKYNLLLKYILRSSHDSGMFVPVDREEDYKKAVFFGVYGSSLQEFNMEKDLLELFQGIKQMKDELDHDLLNPEVSLAITTGGGPGVMNIGNKIANELDILSCGHAVDFTKPHEKQVHREDMNPYLQAKMTYRLEQLVIRQAEFRLDFPIFLTGGVGTDFELALERLRTQVGNKPLGPTILFGEAEYWRAKLKFAYQANRKVGTIKGSEWVSNTFFCVQNAKQALSVYYKFFTNRLHLGNNYSPDENGFVNVTTDKI